MTFATPIWLALTPLIALVAAVLISLSWRQRSTLLRQFAAARLLERLTEKASLQRKLLKSALIVAAFCALGLALARPQFGVEWTQQKARGLDIVFALDTSKSMLATDLRPTRLERSKLAILDLVERLESDRIGLVAFAGQAFLQTPPTLDYSAFRESLRATDPSILSRGGSDLGRAIEEAAKAFPAQNNVKVVILLTDGEDLRGQALDAARRAVDESIQIFTIGIGTPEGEYLRIRNEQGIEEFVRDNKGQPVRSRLDEPTLQQIAQISGGSYLRLGTGTLDTFYDSVLAALPREERESELQEIPIERFQWLLAAALTFLVMEKLIRSRRLGLAQSSGLLLALLIATPQSSEANPYNEAHAALKAGDYALANDLYTEAMQQSDDRQLQRDALYNMGHATYQIGRNAYDQGDVEAALNAFRSAEKLFGSALELDPNDSGIGQDLERARLVRETVEDFVEEQKQQGQEQPQNQEGDENPESSGEKEKSESQESGNPEQEGSKEASRENQSGEQGEPTESSPSGDAQDSEPQGGDAKESEENSEAPSEAGASAENPPGQTEPEGRTPQENEDARTAAGEEPSESEQTSESTEPVPQVGETEKGEPGEPEGGTAQSSASAVLQGMSLQEARDLLDSLQGNEKILPFAKPVPGQGQPLQDW